MDNQNAKDALAVAVAERLKDGQIVGVGTGTTVDAALDALARRVKNANLDVKFIGTSYQTEWRVSELGLVLCSSAAAPLPDWSFDGADAVDNRLRAIKGRGGALLREKILAGRSRSYLLIVDESKLVDNIAARSELPVEVIPESRHYVTEALMSLGAERVTLRLAQAKHGPVITESGNILLDAGFSGITDGLEQEIKKVVGVVESGLFTAYASEVLVAGTKGIRSIKRTDTHSA